MIYSDCRVLPHNIPTTNDNLTFMSRQESECYIYDEEQGLQTFMAPSPSSSGQTPSIISQPSSASPASLQYREDSPHPKITQDASPRQTPRMQSLPQLRHSRAESQAARSPLLPPSGRDSLEGEEPIPRLASGRSSLGDIEGPESVPGIGVSRNGVRGPSLPLPSERGPSSYPSRIESPSPAPSSMSDVEHPDILRIDHQTPLPAPSSLGGEREGSPAQEDILSQGRANALNTQSPRQSRGQRPRLPLSTENPVDSESALVMKSDCRRQDYGIEPQIEMKSFLKTSLPEPKPFRAYPRMKSRRNVKSTRD